MRVSRTGARSPHKRARSAVSGRSTGLSRLPFAHRRWYRPQSMDGCLVGRMDAATRTAWLVLIRPACKTDRARTRIFSGGDQAPISANPAYQRPGIEDPVPNKPCQHRLFPNRIRTRLHSQIPSQAFEFAHVSAFKIAIFPTQQNRELFRRNREIWRRNREFYRPNPK